MRVSIIIRAYNAAATLSRAIESASKQDFPADEYEVIVVDDGSTDETGDIAKRFAGVRYIRQENSGIAHAANRGFKEARGTLVTLLDADDEFLPELLSMSVPFFSDEQLFATYPDYYEEYHGVRRNVSPAHPLQAIGGGMLWRKDRLMSVGGFGEGTIFPEYDLLLSSWDQVKLQHIQEPLMVYHRRSDSLTASEARVQGSIEALAKKYPHLKKEIGHIRSYALGNLILRPATMGDAEILLRWRNDPQTRQNSRHQEVIALPEHSKWLQDSLRDRKRTLRIAEREGRAVGVVRGDEMDGEVELSWTIAPEARGAGLGKEMVLEFVRQETVGKKVRASVRKGHIASEKIAAALGLTPSEEEADSGVPPMMIWK